MSILQNAIDSINIGLEDYVSTDPRRLISATRNLFAGILLLFKYKLVLLSPPESDEVLIKERVLPSLDSDGNLKWGGKGRKTVDVQQIRDRFEQLNIHVDWDRLEKINKYRNDIEHYYSAQSKDSASSLISNSFIIIRDFISKHLGRDPKELLGDEAWNTLVGVAEVYEKEKEDCLATFDAVDWESATLYSAVKEFDCNECGSGLVYIPRPQKARFDNEFACKSCEESWDFESFAEKAMASYEPSANFRAWKDGGDLKIVMCPECSCEAYVVDERHCAVCGTEAEHRCTICSNQIPPEELFLGGYCGWCHHVINKDD